MLPTAWVCRAERSGRPVKARTRVGRVGTTAALYRSWTLSVKRSLLRISWECFRGIKERNTVSRRTIALHVPASSRYPLDHSGSARECDNNVLCCVVLWSDHSVFFWQKVRRQWRHHAVVCAGKCCFILCNVMRVFRNWSKVQVCFSIVLVLTSFDQYWWLLTTNDIIYP